MACDARVDAQYMRTLLQAIARCGHEPLRFVNGGLASLRELPHPRAAVAWDELVDVLERFTEARGRGELNRVAAAFAELHPAPRLLAGYLLPPRLFFRTLGTALGTAACCPVSVREVNGRVFELGLELQPHWRPSQLFFEVYGAAMAALPDVVGFARSKVEVVAVSPRQGRYRVTAGSLSGLSLQATEAQLAAIAAMVATLSGHARRASPRAAVPDVATLEERFELTRAEARVARRLAMGRSLKHIAKDLGISPETARTHAKRAMQKTQTHRQAELVAVVLGPERA
ncbi:MAG: LuxR C-terminal-related transcriptional regulator [Myxococcota bacterium]